MTPSTHPSPTRTPARRPSAVSQIFALISGVMIALACGALWLLVVLIVPGPLSLLWLALPLGMGLGWITRHWVLRASWRAAVLAAVTVLLAAVYMRLLLSVILLANLFNMSFMQALRRAGFDMLAQLAWQSVDTRTIIVYVLAAILGAACAVWRPAR